MVRIEYIFFSFRNPDFKSEALYGGISNPAKLTNPAKGNSADILVRTAGADSWCGFAIRIHRVQDL
jgi:hypothetical protein